MNGFSLHIEPPRILVFFLLQLYAKPPQHLVMLEWIQLMFRGNIVYIMVIIKL